MQISVSHDDTYPEFHILTCIGPKMIAKGYRDVNYVC